MTVDEDSRLVRISTWWQDNPARAAGMYTIKNGQVVIQDTDYEYPLDYPFCHDTPGLARSPWVDGEFKKPGIDRQRLMQEIYGTAAIDTKKLFQPHVISNARHQECAPNRICRLSSHGDFRDDADGEWRFYQDEAVPFTGLYYVGVDPAVGGVDAANAGIVALDARTGELAVVAALPNCNCVELAEYVEALCKLLCGPRGASYAQVIPESQGIGGVFIQQLRRRRWPNIYKDGIKYGKGNTDRGEKVLVELGRAVQDGDIVLQDKLVVDDLECFEYNSKVDLVFTGPVGHGDVGQACALAWWGARTRRRAIMEIDNPPIHETEFLIEQEPGYHAHNKRRNWSDRFALTPRY
jgi:hypothetical protein